MSRIFVIFGLVILAFVFVAFSSRQAVAPTGPASSEVPTAAAAPNEPKTAKDAPTHDDRVIYDPAAQMRNQRSETLLDTLQSCADGAANMEIKAQHVLSRTEIVRYADDLCGKAGDQMALAGVDETLDNHDKRQSIIDVETYNAITSVEREGQ